MPARRTAPEDQPASDASRWSIDRGEPGYPDCLIDLGGAAPQFLYGVGDPAVISGLEHSATVTIVGSRRASAYGLRMAEQLGHDLASAGVAVVSGLAWGIDSAAHRGALTAGGTTIAVLAGGPDVVYPRSARALYDEIAATGAAVAERPFGTTPERWSFPKRNRIMAALATLVIVVEAAEPSGSLITARYALEDLGRDVGAVPGQVGMRSAAGTNRLIVDGAPMIRDVEDALDILAGVGRAAVRRAGPALDRELATVLGLVEGGVTTPDGLAGAGIDPQRATVALTRLELLGYVRSGAGGTYSRTALAAPRTAEVDRGVF